MTDLATTIEQIKNEITVRPDGVGYCTIRGTARLAGVDESTLRQAFAFSANITKKRCKLTQTLIEGGFNPQDFAIKGVSNKALVIILGFYAFDAGARCTEKAKQTYLALVDKVYIKPKKLTALQSIERAIQHRLAIEYNGKTEVKTPVGNIDVLSKNNLIEIKHVKNWKAALGQVLAYSFYEPRMFKMIHLFGVKDVEVLDPVIHVCIPLGVLVVAEGFDLENYIFESEKQKEHQYAV